VSEEGAAALREQVLDACLILAATGCVREITGHVSARIPGTNEIMLRCRRPNDPGVEFTVLDDIRRLAIDGAGWAVIDGYELPGEFAIHSEIYRRRPNVGAVVHGHPRASVLCAVADLKMQPIVGSYDPGMLEMALGALPVFPRSVLIRTPELGRALVDTMGTANACLLRGHGVVTVGATVAEATIRAVKLEALADAILTLSMTGKELHLLSQRDIDEIMQTRAGRAHEFAAWTWEHYRRRAGRGTSEAC
jgi:ribulose-5-phosphate 4-epimerase/fuculose-1-phosphate aldolase